MSTITTTTFVIFFYPDNVDSKIKEVTNRDPHNVVVPRGAYSFRFFEVWSTVIDGVTLKSGHLKYSPVYFYGGRIMSLQEVQNEMPHHKSLIQEMMAEEYESIIQCPGGKIHFWSDDDMVLIQPKTEAMKGHSDAR